MNEIAEGKEAEKGGRKNRGRRAGGERKEHVVIQKHG